jgi:hypothetical protein
MLALAPSVPVLAFGEHWAEGPMGGRLNSGVVFSFQSNLSQA